MTDEIDKWRRRIDDVDEELMKLLKKRTEYAIEIGKIKALEQIAIYDPDREAEVIERVQQHAGANLDAAAIRRLFERIIDETRRAERLASKRR